ncbi:porin family protein [Ferruginibacter sp. SUN002]|uniref:porin family protein n=1 Tax=Ferruginibacter sp. SUN002 TaxID=2937789 RepID=UPI003D362EEC
MKFITTLILAISIVNIGFAQKSKLDNDHEAFFRFGVKAGVNINKIQGSSYKEGYNYNYQVGGFMQFNFSQRLGIQPEVSLVQTSTEFTDDNSNVYNDLFRDGTQKNAKLDYLEVPILLNINVGPSKRVKLQVGPSFGSLLKETVDSLKTPSTFFKKADISAIGGLWLQLPLVNLGARYKIGLNNINNTEVSDEVWRNQAFQIFIGITL